jgi:tetratricopeptide (TPR) repeat protein
MTYQTLFTAYLQGALIESLGRVQAAVPHTLEAVRRQAWHLLSFALSDKSAEQEQEYLWRQTTALLLALAPKMEQAGFRETWIAYLVAAHQESQRRGDRLMMAECALQIGLLYRLLSHFAAAQTWSAASVEQFAALGNHLGERRALNELAWLEQLQHNYTIATQYAERALALSTSNDSERGMSLRVLGMIANNQRHWQTAQAYHEQALAIFEQANDQRRMAWSLQNLAVALQGQTASVEAILLYQRAATILQALGDTYHVAMIEMNLGLNYYRLQQPAEGLPYLLKAATHFHLCGDTLNIAKVETNLGLCHYGLRNYPAAEQAFSTAINAYNQLGDTAWRLNAVSGLGMTYVAAQEYHKAIDLLVPALGEIEQIKEHPYYDSIRTYLQQYLAEARQGADLALGRSSGNGGVREWVSETVKQSQFTVSLILLSYDYLLYAAIH